MDVGHRYVNNRMCVRARVLVKGRREREYDRDSDSERENGSVSLFHSVSNVVTESIFVIQLSSTSVLVCHDGVRL